MDLNAIRGAVEDLRRRLCILRARHKRGTVDYRMWTEEVRKADDLIDLINLPELWEVAPQG